MVITPLIDVVFLLIVFYMLVNNIVAEEAVRMMVPELEDPQTAQLADLDRVVINIAPQRYTSLDRGDNPLAFDGSSRGVKIGLKWYDPSDAAGMTEAIQKIRQMNPGVEVLLRADSALYYEFVQPVMQAVADAGVENVHVAALSEPLSDVSSQKDW